MFPTMYLYDLCLWLLLKPRDSLNEDIYSDRHNSLQNGKGWKKTLYSANKGQNIKSDNLVPTVSKLT